MAKINFTAGRVAEFQCEAGKSQSFLWDSTAPGLGLRVTANGVKSYIFQSKLAGQTIRITIGDPKTWPISAPRDREGKPTGKGAREEANRLQQLINEGKDPRQIKANEIAAALAKKELQRAEEEAQKIREKSESVTLGAVWPIYIESRRKRWSTWHLRDHENVVRRGGEKKVRGKGLTEPGPLAPLLDVRLADLSGQRIGEWLAAEVKNRPTQASLALRLLSVFVNWCESQPNYAGLVPAGACKSQQVRDETPSKNSKDGDSLQREQLALWFKAVREIENSVQSAYLQILLLTGARRRELVTLHWNDVDFQWKSLTIRDKVEGERTIPLTPYVASLLAKLPRRNEWVFSSAASTNGQLVEPTPAHKRALATAGLPDLTLHGLRRSFGTLAEWCEVPAGITAQIMGHKPSAIAEKHYRRRPLDLLRQWHTKIETWILEQAGIQFVANPTGLHVIHACG